MSKILDNKIVQVIKSVIKWIFVCILVLYLLFVIAQRISGNSSIAGFRVFTVATGSMEPVYNIDDVLVVKDINPSTLKVGDDIAYIGERGGLEGILVSHRIIRIEGEGTQRVFFTKGVNNDTEDPSITSGRILGKVEGKLPVINFINHVVRNQYGFFFLVFCPLVLVVFLEVAEVVTEWKKDKVIPLENVENLEEKKEEFDSDEII